LLKRYIIVFYSICKRGGQLPLLGIGKKTEPENADAAKQDVPDELPDLPQAEGAPPAENAEAAPEAAVPDELPPAADLAPDELPPVTELGAAPEPDIQADDRKLYFSSMLQKLHEEGVKSTKLTSTSANLLTDMKKHWKAQKRTAEMDGMMKKVAESITPLQKLEQEWVALSEDIEQKKKILHEKEDQIKKLAEDARSLAMKADRMKSVGK
jgi:hypothetical protein